MEILIVFLVQILSASFRYTYLPRDLKLFRKLVILQVLSTTFCEMAHFIKQSLVSLFKVQADYTCWKDSSLKFLWEFYIKRALFLSSKSLSLVIILLFWLLAIILKTSILCVAPLRIN